MKFRLLQVEVKWDICKLLVLYILVLVVTACSFNYNGLYGQDSYSYLNYSNTVLNYFKGGDFPEHFFWPIAYPLLGAVLATICGSTLWSLFALGILSSAVVLYFVYKIITEFYPNNEPEALIYLGLFYCLSPFLFRYSVSIMSELMTAACITGAVYCCLKYNKTIHAKFFSAFVFLSSLAVITRYAASVILIAPLIWCFFIALKNRKLMHLILSLPFSAMVLWVYLFFKSGEIKGFYTNQWLSTWSFSHILERAFLNSDGWQTYTYPNLVRVLSVFVHPGYIFTGILFLFFISKKELEKQHSVLICIVVFVYLFFLSGVATQNDRFFLLVFPLVLVLYFPVFLRIKEFNFINTRGHLVLGFLLLIQVVLVATAFQPFVRMNKNEKSLALDLTNYPVSNLYTSGVEGALKVYASKHQLHSLYENRFEHFITPSLLLLNPGEIERQWQGKNPGLNWALLKKKYKLHHLQSFEMGWELYEIR